jgi:acyl-CoA synthetase (AMP-forming)/AMP-acid ligase II
MTDTHFNIAELLRRRATDHPFTRAVVTPCGRDSLGRVIYGQLTFAQLDQESDDLARGLKQVGITPGKRTVLMVTPGIDFFILTFALFKVGAVPVVVDPGMGVRRMLNCLQSSRASAFIGVPKAHLLRKRYPKFFHGISIWITAGRRWFWGGHTLNSLYKSADRPLRPSETRLQDTAAILFTTGSTGPAKGVIYTHGNFRAQIEEIRRAFDIQPGEIDLPTFPLFALFDPALGMTAVIPDMDFTRPARVDSRKIIEAIENQGVTNMFASPALLNRVGRYGRQHGIRLPSLRRVVSAGAPVYPDNIERFAGMLVQGSQVHTPYGATEAVPVTAIASDEILGETRRLSEQGYGMCVGRPLEGLDVRIITITDTPIENWTSELELPSGEIGEITVCGDLVTRHYFRNPKADALAKIADDNGFWHRMGDLGWSDKKGRIWFCGRKSHRVITASETLYTVPCESVFNGHPAVFRSALVGVGPRNRQKPVICIEIADTGDPVDKNELRDELLALAAGHPLTASIKVVLFHPSFPVDVRHNSKIFREKLARWADAELS